MQEGLKTASCKQMLFPSLLRSLKHRTLYIIRHGLNSQNKWYTARIKNKTPNHETKEGPETDMEAACVCAGLSYIENMDRISITILNVLAWELKQRFAST